MPLDTVVVVGGGPGVVGVGMEEGNVSLINGCLRARSVYTKEWTRHFVKAEIPYKNRRAGGQAVRPAKGDEGIAHGGLPLCYELRSVMASSSSRYPGSEVRRTERSAQNRSSNKAESVVLAHEARDERGSFRVLRQPSGGRPG
ncbi:unnamed protein product [Merluccius merluccius]